MVLLDGITLANKQDTQGVKSNWTWEQTMRSIITQPLYRALKTLAERKSAFNTYIEQETRRERVQYYLAFGLAHHFSCG